MKRFSILLAGICLALAPLAMGADKDSPYQIDKKAFKKQYKVIALAPIDADPVLELPDNVAAMIEQEITARLQKRGYTVLPTSVLTGIRDTMEKQVGGFTDAETGRTDPAKVQAVRSHAFRELWFREQLDAIAMIRVRVTRAEVENDSAKWDGVKQKLATSGKRHKYAARVAASSVTFAVFDDKDTLLYVDDGGLEMLMRREGQSFIPLTAGQFFSDEKRIRKAAQLSVAKI